MLSACCGNAINPSRRALRLSTGRVGPLLNLSCAAWLMECLVVLASPMHGLQLFAWPCRGVTSLGFCTQNPPMAPSISIQCAKHLHLGLWALPKVGKCPEISSLWNYWNPFSEQERREPRSTPKRVYRAFVCTLAAAAASSHDSRVTAFHVTNLRIFLIGSASCEGYGVRRPSM